MFQIGNIYTTVDWFTGGIMKYRCIGRDEKNALFQVLDKEVDGVSIREERYEILHDSERGEYVLIYEYRGHENRLYSLEV